jgi:lipopolysaccharide export LptBFGC system permease protein LptF
MKLILGIVAVSIVILSGVGYVGTIETKYNTTANMTGFNMTETRLKQLESNYSSTFNKLATEPLNPLTVVYIAAKLGYDSARMLISSIGTFIVMIGESVVVLTTYLPIPTWVTMSITAIIFGAVIIWFVSLLLRWRAG